MRRSEWRRRADDPKSLVGWWWRRMLDRDWRWPFGIVGLAISAWASSNGLPWYVDSLAFGVAIGCLVGKVRRKDALAPLLPDPAPKGQFRADVVYRREGLVLGRDLMALSVVEGWLYAEGVISHFAVRANDVSTLVYRDVVACSVLTLTDGTQVEVLRGGRAAYEALVAWRHDPERPKGESTLPPAKAHMEQIARWLIWSFAGIALSAVAMVVDAFRRQPSPSMNAPSLVALVGGLGAVVLGSARLSRLVSISDKARQEARAKQVAPLRQERVESGDSSPLGSGAWAPRVLPVAENETK